MNVTLTLEDDLVRTARKIAAERDASLTGLIRAYLEELVAEEQRHGRNASQLRALRASFSAHQIELPSQRWTRAELHERR
ncbi:MAG TPA: DUF6364 family protein [Terriglobales bacterium]|nr:DUF6364 family protein [Terriglobales bacterium]